MNKKELIREAAVEVMSRKGFYNTKTAEIAEEAGVAVGTIYNYFENKEDILDYIFKHELEKRLDNLKRIGKKKNRFWEKLKLFLDFHFEEIRDNIAVGEILVREKDFPRKEGSDSINEYLTMIPVILHKQIKAAVNEGEISMCDTEMAANIIFGAVQGIVERAINSGKKEMLNNASEELIKILRDGL